MQTQTQQQELQYTHNVQSFLVPYHGMTYNSDFFHSSYSTLPIGSEWQEFASPPSPPQPLVTRVTREQGRVIDQIR